MDGIHSGEAAVTVLKTILTPRMVAQRTQRTVVEEHSFDMEGSGGEGDFNTEGGGSTAVQYVVGGSGEDGGRAWGQSYMLLCYYIGSEF